MTPRQRHQLLRLHEPVAGPGALESAPPPAGRVAREHPVLDGDLQDLREEMMVPLCDGRARARQGLRDRQQAEGMSEKAILSRWGTTTRPLVASAEFVGGMRVLVLRIRPL